MQYIFIIIYPEKDIKEKLKICNNELPQQPPEKDHLFFKSVPYHNRQLLMDGATESKY